MSYNYDTEKAYQDYRQNRDAKPEDDSEEKPIQKTCFADGCYLAPSVSSGGQWSCRYHDNVAPEDIKEISKRLRDHKPLFDLIADLKRLPMRSCGKIKPKMIPGYPTTKPLEGENIFQWMPRVNMIVSKLIMHDLPGPKSAQGDSWLIKKRISKAWRGAA